MEHLMWAKCSPNIFTVASTDIWQREIIVGDSRAKAIQREPSKPSSIRQRPDTKGPADPPEQQTNTAAITPHKFISSNLPVREWSSGLALKHFYASHTAVPAVPAPWGAKVISFQKARRLKSKGKLPVDPPNNFRPLPTWGCLREDASQVREGPPGASH